eukprot:4639442-Amphidinium_carterae.1
MDADAASGVLVEHQHHTRTAWFAAQGKSAPAWMTTQSACLVCRRRRPNWSRIQQCPWLYRTVSPQLGEL